VRESWYCSKMTAAGKLRRVSPGTYAVPAAKAKARKRGRKPGRPRGPGDFRAGSRLDDPL
jgi:hypothetical protein